MADHDLSEQHIREYAYRLWQEAGSPEGGGEEFWHKAAAELKIQPSASEKLPEPETTGDDIVEKAGGHYPPTGDTQNFA